MFRLFVGGNDPVKILSECFLKSVRNLKNVGTLDNLYRSVPKSEVLVRGKPLVSDFLTF